MKWLSLHYKSFINANLRIFKQPLEHLLNILVVSLIIAILSSIIVISKNINRWQETNIAFPQIMIYLNTSASQNDVSAIEATLNKYNKNLIKSYQFISKAEGLHQLQANTQLQQIASDVISANNNPLPDILIVNTNTTNNKLLLQLTNKIAKMPKVDNVQTDIQYATKVSDLISFIKKITSFLQILFTLVLILIIYNLIRLQMLLRQDEILVSRLIGAADSFIMRPLAYYAILQVIFGTVIAYALVNWFVSFLNGLFLEFNSLFGQAFLLTSLTPLQLVWMLIILGVFAIFAVFLAVQWVFSHSYHQ